MMGVNYLSVFLGSVISGRIGGLYETFSAAQFWTLHAAIVCAGGIAILGIATRMRPILNEREQTTMAAAVA
jgi:POT family proton-dependent oligopeptide transporter